MTWLDRLILRGSPTDHPVPLLRFERLRWAVVVALIIAIMGASFVMAAAQQRQTEECRTRNANTVRTRIVLRDLADAAHDRGDQRTERIFRGLISNQPLPHC